MPVGCRNPRYRFKGNVRLTFCGNRVVEVKKKSDVLKGNRVRLKYAGKTIPVLKRLRRKYKSSSRFYKRLSSAIARKRRK